MGTLVDLLRSTEKDKISVVIPGNEPLLISHLTLEHHIKICQQQLANLGIFPGAAVSIALPNSLEFVISFLATTWQRGIAAPLNPAYKQDEFEFYIADLGTTAVIVPRGAHGKDSPAVRAARKYEAAIVECYWLEDQMMFDVKEKGKLDTNKAVHLNEAHIDDVALVLHTSGTTGKPKAVPLTHKNLIGSVGK